MKKKFVKNLQGLGYISISRWSPKKKNAFFFARGGQLFNGFLQDFRLFFSAQPRARSTAIAVTVCAWGLPFYVITLSTKENVRARGVRARGKTIFITCSSKSGSPSNVFMCSNTLLPESIRYNVLLTNVIRTNISMILYWYHYCSIIMPVQWQWTTINNEQRRVSGTMPFVDEILANTSESRL